MGEPIRILELAERLIRDAGKVPEVRFSGIRPGEKLFEELCGPHDVTLPTSNPRIRVWELPPAEPKRVAAVLQDLAEVANAPRDLVVAALMRAVSEYQPSEADLPTMRLVAAA